MQTRKQYITLLSVISTISVVFLHTNGCFWLFSKGRYWITANIIESVFYFAVPIFFMITGANLIDYQEKYSTKEYFKRRVKKTVIPFIVWSLIGMLYMLATKSISIHNIDIKYIFNGIMNNSFSNVYWFFIPLFCTYLCIPLFASVDKMKRIATYKYLIIVALIFNCILPFINTVFGLGLSMRLSVYVCAEYTIYVLLGYVIDNIEINKKKRYIIYFFGIIGLLTHIIGTYKLSYAANTIIKTYKGYTNLPCILYSVSIYIFIKNISLRFKNYKIINFIGEYSFVIYLSCCCRIR